MGNCEHIANKIVTQLAYRSLVPFKNLGQWTWKNIFQVTVKSQN